MKIRIDEPSVDERRYARTPVEAVTFSPKVRRVGGKAFYCCRRLREVVFEGNGPVELGPACFAQCGALKSVRLPKVSRIPERCFTQSGLEAIELPEGVVSIDAQAFYFCTNLTRVKLPKTLCTVDKQAFQVTEIHFGRLDLSHIVRFGEEAFRGCRIEHLIIGKSHAAIPDRCFEDCGIEYAELLPPKNRETGPIELKPYCLAGNPNMTIRLPGERDYRIGKDAFYCQEHVWFNVHLPDPYRSMRLMMPGENEGSDGFEEHVYEVDEGSIRILRY